MIVSRVRTLISIAVIIKYGARAPPSMYFERRFQRTAGRIDAFLCNFEGLIIIIAIRAKAAYRGKLGKIFRIAGRAGKFRLIPERRIRFDAFYMHSAYWKEENATSRLRGKSKREITNFSPSFQPTRKRVLKLEEVFA